METLSDDSIEEGITDSLNNEFFEALIEKQNTVFRTSKTVRHDWRGMQTQDLDNP